MGFRKDGEMIRYEPVVTVEAKKVTQMVSQMCPTEDGRWVRYDDVKEEMDRLQAESALKDVEICSAADLCEELLGYVPEYFCGKHNYRGDFERLRKLCKKGRGRKAIRTCVDWVADRIEEEEG